MGGFFFTRCAVRCGRAAVRVYFSGVNKYASTLETCEPSLCVNVRDDAAGVPRPIHPLYAEAQRATRADALGPVFSAAVFRTRRAGTV